MSVIKSLFPVMFSYCFVLTRSDLVVVKTLITNPRWIVSSSVLFFIQGKKIEGTPLAMYNYFIERVKQNLHVALAMSPIGDAFRNRLRMFPSLINCCTIDWFQVSYCFLVLNSKLLHINSHFRKGKCLLHGAFLSGKYKC